jgi:hypothetical protein
LIPVLVVPPGRDGVAGPMELSRVRAESGDSSGMGRRTNVKER